MVEQAEKRLARAQADVRFAQDALASARADACRTLEKLDPGGGHG